MGDAYKAELEPQSEHPVENQPGTNDPYYAGREWARLTIEALTLLAIIGGAWAAFSTLESINKSVGEAGRSANAAEKCIAPGFLDSV